MTPVVMTREIMLARRLVAESSDLSVTLIDLSETGNRRTYCNLQTPGMHWASRDFAECEQSRTSSNAAILKAIDFMRGSSCMSFMQHLVQEQGLPTGMERSLFALLDVRPGCKDFMTVRLDDFATQASEEATTLDWTGTTCINVNEAFIALISTLIDKLDDGDDGNSVCLGYYPLPTSTTSYLTSVLHQGHESRLYTSLNTFSLTHPAFCCSHVHDVLHSVMSPASATLLQCRPFFVSSTLSRHPPLP